MEITITKTREKAKELLQWRKRNEAKVLDSVFGLLKRLKKDPVRYQRELRQDKI